MRFIIKIDENKQTLEDAYNYLSGLGQRLYDELSDDEKSRLDNYLNGLPEVTPEIVDDILVNYREVFE